MSCLQGTVGEQRDNDALEAEISKTTWFLSWRVTVAQFGTRGLTMGLTDWGPDRDAPLVDPSFMRAVSVKATIITAEEDDCEKDEACDDPFAEMDCYLVNTSVNNKDVMLFDEHFHGQTVRPQLHHSQCLGLGIRAQNAKLEMADDGYSENKFWLLDYNGKKLSDTKAENLQERIRDFVLNCQPHMMNEQVNVAPEGHDFRQKGRVFRFLITDGVNGGKLTAGRTNSILYTMCLVAGKGCAPFPYTPFPLPPSFMSLAQNSSLICSLSSQNAGRVNSVLYMMDLVAGKGYQPTRLKKIDHDVPVASLCQPSAYLTGDHRAPAYLA
eukprot:gene17497-23806_t